MENFIFVNPSRVRNILVGVIADNGFTAQERKEIARNGFKGVSDMEYAELLQCVKHHGLLGAFLESGDIEVK